ncbi:2354_t:CDS:1, partial [Scutellospora calospora]
KKETYSKHPRGRLLDPVCDYFFTTPLKSLGHFATKYKYCSTQFNHRYPN